MKSANLLDVVFENSRQNIHSLSIGVCEGIYYAECFVKEYCDNYVLIKNYDTDIPSLIFINRAHILYVKEH